MQHLPNQQPTMQQTDLNRAARLPQLDFLRGFAILLVLFFHPLILPEHSGLFHPLAIALARFGWTGVDLFFVLSGFLVGGLLFKEIRTRNSLDFGRFIIRRGLKIWPGYFALLAVAFFLAVRHNGMHVAILQVRWNVMQVQNYFGTIRGHTWSLAVEEHFYLFLPLLLLILLKVGRRGISAIPFIAGALAIICLALRIHLITTHPQSEWRLGETHLRMDALFFGVALAYAQHFHADRYAAICRHRIPLLLIAAICLAPMFYFDALTPFVCTIGYTLLFLGYGILLSVLVHTAKGAGIFDSLIASPIGRGLGFIGFYSYSIYLWFLDFAQDPLRHFTSHFARVPGTILWPVGMAVYVAVAVLVGIIMAKLIEFPGLALRDRLFPARASLPATLNPAELNRAQTDDRATTIA